MQINAYINVYQTKFEEDELNNFMKSS